MSEIVNTATIRVEVDGSQVNTGMRQIVRDSSDAARAVTQIGAGATGSARQVEAAQRNIVAAIQRATAEGQRAAAAMDAGSRSTARFFENLAGYRGVDTQALAPYLNQLRAVEELQARSARAAAAQQAEQLRAAEAARVEAAAQRELAQAHANRDAFIAGLREQIQLFGRSTEEVLQYRAAQAGASAEAAQLILQLRNMRAAQEQVAQAARNEAEAQRAAERAQTGRDSFIESLQRETEAIGRTRLELMELRAAQLGVSNQAAPLIARLREAEGGLSRTGASAAQTAAALRMVPAQVTDIVTSLQGGQAPLTVFLQQGGQLRDMFGSSGAAARALGGYVMGLITPYTVAAAAVGVLAIAYHQGSEEARKYGAALITSGNAAGTSADKLALMAQHISGSIGTQGAAAEALTALVATGKVAADNLDYFGAVAVRGQRALGQSVADTAGEFAELAKSPVSALEKLNEQYHFLTGSIYEHVRTLHEQGRDYEAAQAAQQAYANAFDGVTAKVDKNLGTMQKGWRGVTDFAKGAWDAMLNVGREDTLEEKLAKVRKSIEKASKPFDGAVGGNAEDRVNLKANKDLEASLEKQIAARDREAALEAGKARLNTADLEWSKVKLSNLSRQKQLENELNTVRNKGLEAGISDKDISDELLKVRQKYADIFNAGVDSNIAAMKRRDQVADVLEQRELARIVALRTAGGMSEDDSIAATANAELAAFGRKRALLEAELALTKQKANSVKEQADLEGQMAVLDEQRKSRAIQLTQDLFAAEQKRYRLAVDNSANLIEKEVVELNSLKQQTQAQFDYNEAIGLSQRQVAALTASRLLDAAARKEAEADIAEGLDLTGERAARIRDEAAAIRARAGALMEGAAKQERYDQWKQAVDQYGQVFQQGFADMLNNGRDGWSSFTKSLVTTFKTSVADQIYKMFARPIIVQLVGNYMGVSPQAIAGEIGSQPNAYGVTGSGSSPIGAAQAASSLYSAIDGGFAKVGSTIASGYDSIAGMFGSSAAGGAGASGAGASAGSAGGAAASAGSAGGAAVGAAASVAAAYMAGVAIGRSLGNSISSGYGVTGNSKNFVNWNVLLSPWAIGGGIAGGLTNRLFGMRDKEITSQGIRGTLNADDLTGTNYANWHQDGGWFRSDKSGTETKALTAEIVKQFTEGLHSIESVSTGFASSLGVSADWIKDYSKTFDIALTDDATKNQQAITDFFSGIGDEIAKKLVPNLDELSKSGESASAALQRLAGDFKGTDQVAQLLGFSASALFGAAGVESAKTREQLIDLAGGLSVLNQQAAFFNQNFLTDAERIKPVAEALDKALASLGLSSIPKTRDEFKALVNCLIDSGAAATETGAKQLDSLLALGAAFAQVHPAMDATTDAATKAADALQSMKDAASGLLGGVDNSFSVLQKVVGREKAAVQVSVDAHTAAFTKLQSLSQALHSTLDSLKSPDQKAMERAVGQAQIRAALAIAKAGGPLPDADSLKGALSAIQQDASSQFSSYTDYLRDLYQTQNDIAALGQVTDSQLSVEQKALDAAKEQLKSLDGILDNAQSQIDVLKGIDTNGLTLVQAMQALTQAIVGAQSNPIVGATASINQAYQQYLGRAPDAEGLQWWQNAAASGAPVPQIVDGIKGSTEAELNRLYQSVLGRAPDAEGLRFWMNAYGPQMDDAERADWLKDAMATDEYKKLKGIPGFANGGLFGGGARIVGEDHPEIEVTGPSRILSAQELTRRLTTPAQDTGALVAEVKALRETVARQQAALDRIADNTKEHKDMFEQSTGGGGPLLVEIA